MTTFIHFVMSFRRGTWGGGWGGGGWDGFIQSRLKVTAVSYNAVITALHREDKPVRQLLTKCHARGVEDLSLNKASFSKY